MSADGAGHVALDDASGEAYDARRLGALLEIVGDGSNVTDPLFLLDAGCGKGYLARALARCGHRVDAIDASRAVVHRCRAYAETGGTAAGAAPAAGGGPRFFVSTLSRWRSAYLYDVAYAIDVLFHILDDDEWAASLANVASLVRLAGTLVVTDEWRRTKARRGDHVVHRGHREYERVLAHRGFAFRDFRPYRFRDSQVGFHTYTRIH